MTKNELFEKWVHKHGTLIRIEWRKCRNTDERIELMETIREKAINDGFLCFDNICEIDRVIPEEQINTTQDEFINAIRSILNLG